MDTTRTQRWTRIGGAALSAAVLACTTASARASGVGACCLPSGTCIEVTADLCSQLDGVFQGVGRQCSEGELLVWGAFDPDLTNTQLFVLNLTTATADLVGPPVPNTDVEGSTFFGTQVVGVSGEFGTDHNLVDLDFGTGAITPITGIDFGVPTEVTGMASDASGVHWAFLEDVGFATVEIDGSFTLELDCADFEAELLNTLGVDCGDIEGLAVSLDGSTLYAITSKFNDPTVNGKIIEFDVATGAFALLADVGDMFGFDPDIENLELFSENELAFITMGPPPNQTDLIFAVLDIVTGDLSMTLIQNAGLGDDVETIVFPFVTCPPPTTGACCLPNGDCVDEITELECELLDGDYQGDSTDCTDVVCPSAADCCEFGKPVILTMQYTGEDCSATSHGQDPGKVTCQDLAPLLNTVFIRSTNKSNPNDLSGKIWFAGDVSVGELFDISAIMAGEDKLAGDTFIHIFEAEGGTLLQTVKFHTSCSQPLETGDQFGASLLVACVGEDEPVEGSCCEFGKPRLLTMQYTADDCSATSHMQDPGKVVCEDFAPLPATVFIRSTNKSNPNDLSGKIWFADNVSVGELFNIDALAAGEDKLAGDTFIHIFNVEGGTLLQTVKFHTSCSQPLFVDNQFGASLLVACEGEDEPVEGSCCDFGKPRLLTMQYTAEDCSATSHAQDAGKVACEDLAPLLNTVFIRSTNKANPNDLSGKIWFDGDVSVGELFDIDALAAGEAKLENDTFIHIFAGAGGMLLQTVKFHTSCSQPLFVDNQFGASLLVACEGEDEPVEGSCCDFGKPRLLTMQYTAEDCGATSHGQDAGKVACEDLAPLLNNVFIRSTNKANPNDISGKIWFAGFVSTGELFDIDAIMAGEDKLESDTFIHIFSDEGGTLLQTAKFHTSCSQPLFVGNQFGASLLVGCVGEDEPGEGAFCADGVKPRALIVQYTGDDCDASSHFQDPGKVACAGDPLFEILVRIRASNKENPDDGGADVWFDDLVVLGVPFAIDALNAGESKLSSNTFVHVFDLQNNLLQSIKFHTSCSQPLNENDQFGSIRLLGFVPESNAALRLPRVDVQEAATSGAF